MSVEITSSPAIKHVDTANGWVATRVDLPPNTFRVSVDRAVDNIADSNSIACRIGLVGEDGVLLETDCVVLAAGDCWYHDCRTDFSPGVSTVASIFVATEAVGLVIVETEA